MCCCEVENNGIMDRHFSRCVAKERTCEQIDREKTTQATLAISALEKSINRLRKTLAK